MRTWSALSASGLVFCCYKTQLDRSLSLTRAHTPIRVKAKTGRMGAVSANAWASMYFDKSCMSGAHRHFVAQNENYRVRQYSLHFEWPQRSYFCAFEVHNSLFWRTVIVLRGHVPRPLICWCLEISAEKVWKRGRNFNVLTFGFSATRLRSKRHFVFMSCILLYYARPVLNLIRCQFEGEKKLEKMRIIFIVAFEPSVQQFKMPCEGGHEINSPGCCPFVVAQTFHRKWLQVNHLEQPSVNRGKKTPCSFSSNAQMCNQVKINAPEFSDLRHNQPSALNY